VSRDEPASAIIELAPTPVNVGAARRFVRQELSEQRSDIPAHAVDDLVLATSELVTNAISYSTGGTVRVAVERGRGSVSVAVTSAGMAPDVGPVDAWEQPEPQALTGRGLAIVREVSDSVLVGRADGMLTIRAVLEYSVDERARDRDRG